MSTGRVVAHRALALAFAVGVLAPACGSGAGRLSTSEYRSRAGAHCATLEDASTELREAQASSAAGATVTKYLHRAADRLRDLVHDLDGLEPPRAFEPDVDELLGLLDGYADGLDDLADDVGPDDTLATTFQKHQRLVERLNGVANDATALVTRLELTGCILG